MTAGRRGQVGRSGEARRLRDLLRSELHRGGYSDGRLPPEEQLMTEFGVSRSTVRDALALLRSEGLVERVQGVGTIVMQSKVAVGLDLNEFHGVVDPEPGSLLSGQMYVRILDWREVPLPDTAARSLHVDAGHPGLRIDYVAWHAGEPIGVATNYVRHPEAAALDRAQFRTDWYALLEAAELKIAETTFLMEASIADQHDAELLRIAAGSPILLSEQVIYGPDGVAFDFALLRSRGDRTAVFSRARRTPA
ncbi:MAG TPA: GntR family transcriptional regulator [Jatrophihabitantaceae bacterium]